MIVEHNIYNYSNKLWVYVRVDGKRNYNHFDNIEEARNYRDDLLKKRSSINAKIALAIELFVSGMNYPEIKEETGLDVNQLSRYITKYFPYKGLDPVVITLHSKV